MLQQYFEHLLGTFVPIAGGATIFDKIDWKWVLLSFVVIIPFHCVMRLLAVLLRKVLKNG